MHIINLDYGQLEYDQSLVYWSGRLWGDRLP
jgi:hypothetical protein